MSDYISTTNLCNIHYNNRAFNILCKYQEKYLLNKYDCIKETDRCIYDTNQILMNKGIDFEKNVCKYIRNRFCNKRIEEFNSLDNPEQMRKKMKLFIKQRVPIIFQAYLWDENLRIHGHADLMLRNDIVVELFNNLPEKFINLHNKSIKNKNFFYIIIDVKCKNTKIGNDIDFHIRDGKSDHEDYCFQVTTYYYMLKKIIKQIDSDLMIPKFSCILGYTICVEGTQKKTKNCFEKLAFVYHDDKKRNRNKMYTRLKNQIVENANLFDAVIENGNMWDIITNPTLKVFYPKKDKDYFPYNNLKKKILSEIKPSKKKTDDRVSFAKKMIIREQDKKRLNSVQYTINLDLEFLNAYQVEDFRNFPNTFGFYCMYMIGITVYEGNKFLEKKQFIMDKITKEEQYNICRAFSNYIENLTGNYQKSFIILHWTSAEKTGFKKFIQEEPRHIELSFFKNYLKIEERYFFDLWKMFKGDIKKKIPAIELPNGYGIKNVLKLCKKYGLTNLDWEDNDMDGFNTIAASLMYYNNPINNAYIMDIIKRYNIIDCNAMWELRNILLYTN
tara:strand:- start:330 stop:2000 length:1671 start_codon:yes stop_codon:yes gene_type:complete